MEGRARGVDEDETGATTFFEREDFRFADVTGSTFGGGGRSGDSPGGLSMLDLTCLADYLTYPVLDIAAALLLRVRGGTGGRTGGVDRFSIFARLVRRWRGEVDAPPAGFNGGSGDETFRFRDGVGTAG